MAFMAIFKKKPGGTFVGNFLRATIPVANAFTHIDKQGNKHGWVHDIMKIFN